MGPSKETKKNIACSSSGVISCSLGLSCVFHVFVSCIDDDKDTKESPRTVCSVVVCCVMLCVAVFYGMHPVSPCLALPCVVCILCHLVMCDHRLVSCLPFFILCLPRLRVLH